MLPLLRCFFARLLILQYPDHHQNLISSSLYYSGPVHKISSQSVHNFLSNVVHRQTDRQTDKLTKATKNITSFAKEVTTLKESIRAIPIRNFAFRSLRKFGICFKPILFMTKSDKGSDRTKQKNYVYHAPCHSKNT